MAQIRNTQIRDNDLTGRTINRNFRFFDEQEVPINKGEIRFWQSKWWQVTQDITVTETGGDIPAEGDISYSPDVETEYWRQLPNYGSERYEFEVFGFYNYPITQITLDESLSSTASRMKNNFESYSKLLFDIHNSSSGDYLGKQFATSASFITWVNDNLTTGDTIVRVYGNVDGDSTNIHKLHGRNFAYGIIKGNDSSSNSQYYKGMCGQESNWDNIEAFSMDILERITGVTPSDATNASRCIWFPQNNQNLYKLYPTINSEIEIEFTGGVRAQKRSFDPATNTFNTINTSDIFSSIPGSNGFYSIRTTNYSWQFAGVQHLPTGEYFRPTHSYVKVYGFQDSSGNIGVIVKPVGMDEFRLTSIEETGDKTYYSLSYNDDDKPKVMDISSEITHLNQELSNIDVIIYKEALVNCQNAKGVTSPSTTTLKNVKFFYSDDKGNISKFSPEIRWHINRPGAKIMTLLNN